MRDREPARWASAALSRGEAAAGRAVAVRAGLFSAAGTAASLHYLGVIVAGVAAIGEVGEIRGRGLHRRPRRPARRGRRRVGPARSPLSAVQQEGLGSSLGRRMPRNS